MLLRQRTLVKQFMTTAFLNCMQPVRCTEGLRLPESSSYVPLSCFGTAATALTAVLAANPSLAERLTAPSGGRVCIGIGGVVGVKHASWADTKAFVSAQLRRRQGTVTCRAQLAKIDAAVAAASCSAAAEGGDQQQRARSAAHADAAAAALLKVRMFNGCCCWRVCTALCVNA